MEKVVGPVDVRLIERELRRGVSIGCERHLENICNGRVCRMNRDKGLLFWQHFVEGALGEMALAKHLGVLDQWGKGITGAPDVLGFEVRTRPRHNYDLIIKPSDPETMVYWLVTGLHGVYKIQGWIEGYAGKLECYFDNHTKKTGKGARPAYFVPQSALRREWTIKGMLLRKG